MGRRGPKPQPTALRLLRGNPSKRPINRNEPKPREGVPDCPDWLDDEAKAKWAEIVPELEHMGVLTKAERDKLTLYCHTWTRWRRAEKFIAEHGNSYPIKDGKGNLKYLQQFAEVSIARNLLIALNRMLSDFGMDPASRSRIDVTRPKAEDQFEVFLKSKHKGKKSG